MPVKPKIIYVGGEDHHLRIPFMRRLESHGFHVVAVGSGECTPFRQEGIPYIRFTFDRFANPWADFKAIRQLAEIIERERPQLINSFDTKPNLLVPFALRRTATSALIVRTINGMGWLFSSESSAARALRPVYCRLHRIAARSTSATIFQNRQDQEFFTQHGMIGSSVNRLIPGSGIDLDGFIRSQAEGAPPETLRAALGLGSSEIVITVTRLTRQKGIGTLLRAAEMVHRIRPGVRFLLVGPRESEGQQAIPQAEIDCHAPYVVAIGPRSDVPQLLRLANVFAFPTEYREGVPRVLLEAAFAGLPIVTTTMPGCSDIVIDRETGLLVPPRSPHALAEGIIELLKNRDLADEMGRCAARRVSQEYGLDRTVERYAELYYGLLTGMRDAPLSLPEVAVDAKNISIQPAARL
jgi:glycosyltransferase involved in cell wall biosynthesis